MDVQAFVTAVGGWLATTNGIIGTLIACVTGLGTLMTTVYAMFQGRKLSIDKVFGREKHNLQLFVALADPNPQLQLAAAAVLVERLKRLDTRAGRSDDDPHERIAIIRALVSVTKVGVDGNAFAEPSTTFTGARLQGAIFAGADLHDARFDGADLSGADLRSARNFATATFARAVFDSKTQFPDDAAFAPKRAEMIPTGAMAA